MSAISLLLIGLAVIVAILLIVVLVAQVKSNRHIESLKKSIDKSCSSKETGGMKPKIMKGAASAKMGGAAAVTEAAAAEPAAEIPEAPAAEAEEEILETPVEAAAVEIEEISVEIKEVPPEIEEAPAEIEAAAVEAEEAPAFEPTPYPEFDNARAVEQLGLSQEEADMFIFELVTQIEEEIPNLDAAIAANDVDRLEKVSHMLKGSATSLGEGGVADVLVAFNTYCKDGNDPQVIKDHMENLRYYFGKLKEKFVA